MLLAGTPACPALSRSWKASWSSRWAWVLSMVPLPPAPVTWWSFATAASKACWPATTCWTACSLPFGQKVMSTPSARITARNPSRATAARRCASRRETVGVMRRVERATPRHQVEDAIHRRAEGLGHRARQAACPAADGTRGAGERLRQRDRATRRQVAVRVAESGRRHQAAVLAPGGDLGGLDGEHRVRALSAGGHEQMVEMLHG